MEAFKTIRMDGDPKLIRINLDKILMVAIKGGLKIREWVGMQNMVKVELTRTMNDIKANGQHMRWLTWETLLSSKNSIRIGKRQN